MKQCCKQPGSRKLAEFIVKHLRSGGQFQADGSESLRSIFRAITRCGDLKRALSRLKKYAATCSKRDSRKGWVRLRNALQAALDFVTAISSTPEMLRDFHLTHYQELQSSAWLGRPKKRLVHFQKLHAQENLHLTKALFKADERAGASAQKAAERA